MITDSIKQTIETIIINIGIHEAVIILKSVRHGFFIFVNV